MYLVHKFSKYIKYFILNVQDSHINVTFRSIYVHKSIEIYFLRTTNRAVRSYQKKQQLKSLDNQKYKRTQVENSKKVSIKGICIIPKISISL